MVGVPIAYYAAFETDFNLSGVWLGPCIANIFLAICYNVLIAKTDLRELILDA